MGIKRRIITFSLSLVMISTAILGIPGCNESIAATNTLPSGDESNSGGSSGGGSASPFDFSPGGSTVTDGEMDVPLDSIIMMKFDKAVSQPEVLSKNAEKISVIDQDGNKVAISITPVPKGIEKPTEFSTQEEYEREYRRFLTINFNDGLKADKTYTITLESGIEAKNGIDKTIRSYTIMFSTIKSGLTPNPTPNPKPLPDFPPISEEKSYSDIENHWGKDYIISTTNKGLFSGTSETEFSPDVVTTRAMLVTVLGRLSGERSSFYERFSDVSDGQYYSKHVAWAEKNGIVYGYEDGTFRPDNKINREEMAAIISRYLKYKEINVNDKPMIAFSDISEISTWAVLSVEKLQRAEILSGKGNNNYRPHDFTTRAEIATVMDKLLKMYIN